MIAKINTNVHLKSLVNEKKSQDVIHTHTAATKSTPMYEIAGSLRKDWKKN